MAQRSSAGHNIGELLLREGLITEAQLDLALVRQRDTEQPLVRILVESGFLEDTKRLNFFKRHFGAPVVLIEPEKLDALLYTYIPGPIARKHHLVPVKLDRDGLVVAMEDPSDLVLLDNLKEIAGLRIKPVVSSTADIIEALKGYPAEKPVESTAAPKAQRFDWVTRLLSFTFMPFMSLAVLFGILALLYYSPAAQAKYAEYLGRDSATKSSQIFSLFLYFFLSWGVYTIIVYEIVGLVFDDMEWRDPADVGESRQRGRALLYSIFLGWLGVDRFYLGYSRLGALKLVTLGLFGIWWILDVIALVGRDVPDAAGRRLQ